MSELKIKRDDILFIVVTMVVSSVIAIIIANVVFKINPSKSKVEVVKKITNDFPLPPSDYFNKDSLNPTQLIKIGDSNPKPFN